MSELKPCPFCGGEGNLKVYGTYTYCWVACACGVSTCGSNDPAEAIAQWNMRCSDSTDVNDGEHNNLTLKPCPFCGGEASEEGDNLHWIICPFCGVESEGSKCRKKAIEQWNARISDTTTIDDGEPK